jgi:2-keto-myo-inositol isomerase
MMKPCLNEYTLRTTPTELFLDASADAGFEAIEFAWENVVSAIESDDIPRLNGIIKEKGLKVASINGPDFCTLLDETEFEEVLKRAKDLAAAGMGLGCDLLIASPPLLTEPMSHEAVVSRSVKALHRLSEMCGDDMKIGFEFLGFSNSSVKDLRTANEIVTQVRKENVGLVVDPFMFHLSRLDYSDLEMIERDRLFLVHVNDSEPGPVAGLTDANRLYPGEGVLKLDQFKSELAKVGYDGYLSLETYNPSYWVQNPRTVAKEGRRSLDRIFGI